MWLRGTYQRLASDSPFDDVEEGGGTKEADDNKEAAPEISGRRGRACGWFVLLICIALSAASLFVPLSQLLWKSGAKCTKPSTRREWRSLDTSEQHEYIRAVNCLRDTPSRLGLNQSLYDDFPWVHSQVGDAAHESAQFVAWHRYFLKTYEKALQDECGFLGSLTYWDWTLDWQDIRLAPIWGEDAFGGADFSNTAHEATDKEFLHGHCVTNGPFSHLQVLYVKGKKDPHCLTRGFAPDEELKNLSSWIRPQAIEQLLAHEDYEAFNLGLEHAGHIAIPRSIRGDFLLLTAPYDPIFFLHHTQLDRLWSKWQKVSPHRAKAYRGAAYHHSTEQASLGDEIRMGGLAPDVRVADIIDTESGILCYRY